MNKHENSNKIEENIFLALGKYKYNYKKRKGIDDEGLSEQENYFTEAFCILLKKDSDLAKCFIIFLVKEKIEKDKFLKNEIEGLFKIYPHHYQGKIPDIHIEFKKLNIIVEVKLKSKQGKDQIADYLEQGYVAYITLNYEKIDNSEDSKFLGHFKWYNIYKLLEDYKNNSSKNDLLKEFLEFMEVLKMKPIDISGIMDFNENTLNTYQNLVELKDKIITSIKNLDLIEYSIVDDVRDQYYPHEYKSEQNILFIELFIRKFMDGNSSQFFYSINFDNTKISVVLNADEGVFNEKVLSIAKIKGYKNKNNDEISLSKDLNEIFNADKPQQDVIIEFVSESIQRFGNELLPLLN